MSEPALHERIGFEIGWDYACYGIPFPPTLLRADGRFKCIVDGYHEGKTHFGNGNRCKAVVGIDLRYNTKWMNLRISALKRNRILTKDVTPEYLSHIDVPRCPVTRLDLTHGTGELSDASIERMNNRGGYAVGNLCVMSVLANRAKGRMNFRQVMETALTVGRDDLHIGLTGPQWARLACLSSFGAGSEDASIVNGLPLLCLPPRDTILTNATQHLQCMATSLLIPNQDPKVSGRITKAFGMLKDKKVNRALRNFFLAGQHSYNRAFFELEGPRPIGFVLGDAWKNAVLFGYWNSLRTLVGSRAHCVINAAGFGPNVGTADQSQIRFNTWGLESSGHVPAKEW